MVSSSARFNPACAALIGSMSPTMSAIVTSGVASFSTNRSPRDSHPIGRWSPSRAACAADGVERIVVNLAARDDRNPLVEQFDQTAQNPALRLAAQAEEDE